MGKTVLSRLTRVVMLILPVILVAGYYINSETRSIRNETLVELNDMESLLLLSKELNINIVQIQQWLTDISATRGAEGFDDGYTEAEGFYKKAMENLQTFKRSPFVDKATIESLETQVSSFYETGKKMASLYIASGPSAGNEFMGTFDKDAEALQQVLEPFLNKVEGLKAEASEHLDSSLSGLTTAVLVSFLLIVLVVGLGLGLFGHWLMKNIQGTSVSIFKSVEELKSFGRTLETRSNDLNTVISTQASSLQETVSSIDEISSMLQKSSDAAKSSTEISSQSAKAANRGKATVEEMIAAISRISTGNDEIMEEIRKSNQEISNIVNVISEIGEKTKVINDIVFQTKLLSFNASVEAARAGEHGKGFAVVAEEVGNLAAMSGKASLEISSLLESSIESVKGIVDNTKTTVESLISQGKKRIDEGTDTATACGKSLDEILQNVSALNDMVNEIASAISEQSIGVNEVTKAMQSLDNTTHESTSVSNESLEMAKKVVSQAASVEEKILKMMALAGLKKTSLDSETEYDAETPHSVEPSKVISLAAHGKSAPERSSSKSSSKKVVGLEGGFPDSEDSRFEELE